MIDETRVAVVARLKGLGFQREEIEWFTGSWDDYPLEDLESVEPVTGDSGAGEGGIKVSFRDGKVTVWSPETVTVRLGGDVRDRTVSINAGASRTYSLTGEGFGYVSVDGDQYPY